MHDKALINAAKKALNIGINKFSILPFNHLDNEDTKYKGDILDYHIVDLFINKVTFIHSWNSTVDVRVNLALTKN